MSTRTGEPDPWGVSPYEHALALHRINASTALHARSTALHIGIALYASQRAAAAAAVASVTKEGAS